MAAEYLNYRKRPALFPQNPLILSLDDGNKSHYRAVFPLLKKYGFKATFFIYPHAVSRKPDNQHLHLSADDSQMNFYMSSWGFDSRNSDGSEAALF